MEDKLKELLSLCKCSVSIVVNNHRDYYQTVEQYMNDNSFNEIAWNETEKEIRNKIIETDNLIEIQFYPITPVGFYSVYHYDINEAINEALNILKTN